MYTHTCEQQDKTGPMTRHVQVKYYPTTHISSLQALYLPHVVLAVLLLPTQLCRGTALAPVGGTPLTL